MCECHLIQLWVDEGEAYRDEVCLTIELTAFVCRKKKEKELSESSRTNNKLDPELEVFEILGIYRSFA